MTWPESPAPRPLRNAGASPSGVFGWIVRAVGILLLLAAFVVDLNSVSAWDVPGTLLALASLTAVAALVLPARLRPGWLSPGVRTAVPALLAIAANLVLRVDSSQIADTTERPGLVLALLCLLVVAARRCVNPWIASACVALLCGALAGIPLTVADLDDSDVASALAVLTLLAAGFTGLGAFLRSSDTRHRAAVRQVQIDERLAVAADLHDFVAHHVTGILVQAQVARLMATADAPRLDPVLGEIEHAASEALTSMRRLVGVLRTGGDESDLRPAGDLTQLAQTVDTFSRVGPRAILRQDEPVTEDLPHVIQSAAFRIVQESLTNVRKHAVQTTEVVIDLKVADDALEVGVTDDGGPAPSAASVHGGGFGLVGLTERVTALGGDIKAGPVEGGWSVHARLPLTRPQNRPAKTGPSIHA